MPELTARKCSNLSPGTPPLDRDQATLLLSQVPGWQADGGMVWLTRQFDFKDFYHSMEFANTVALIANAENHHPDLELGYKKCLVKFTTHSVKGLSENDFICAAKINRVVDLTR
jgi:4a-hydroxytetrahydrobiopterin dehydratase